MENINPNNRGEYIVAQELNQNQNEIVWEELTPAVARSALTWDQMIQNAANDEEFLQAVGDFLAADDFDSAAFDNLATHGRRHLNWMEAVNQPLEQADAQETVNASNSNNVQNRLVFQGIFVGTCVVLSALGAPYVSQILKPILSKVFGNE